MKVEQTLIFQRQRKKLKNQVQNRSFLLLSRVKIRGNLTRKLQSVLKGEKARYFKSSDKSGKQEMSSNFVCQMIFRFFPPSSTYFVAFEVYTSASLRFVVWEMARNYCNSMRSEVEDI